MPLGGSPLYGTYNHGPRTIHEDPSSPGCSPGLWGRKRICARVGQRASMPAPGHGGVEACGHSGGLPVQSPPHSVPVLGILHQIPINSHTWMYQMLQGALEQVDDVLALLLGLPV